jgi:hypothetical protein
MTSPRSKKFAVSFLPRTAKNLGYCIVQQFVVKRCPIATAYEKRDVYVENTGMLSNQFYGTIFGSG